MDLDSFLFENIMSDLLRFNEASRAARGAMRKMPDQLAQQQLGKTPTREWIFRKKK